MDTALCCPEPVLYLAALYAIVHTVWFRAGDIARLPEGTLPAFDIASIASRLVGEVAAITLGYAAVAGAVIVWVVRSEVTDLTGEVVRPMGGLGGFGASFLGNPMGIFPTRLATWCSFRCGRSLRC
jgi:hypothetical protein